MNIERYDDIHVQGDVERKKTVLKTSNVKLFKLIRCRCSNLKLDKPCSMGKCYIYHFYNASFF